MPVVMLPRSQSRNAMPRTALAAFTADSARDFACDVLRAAGVVSVVPAGGGRDALRTSRGQHIDVIVTDWPADDIDLDDFVKTLRTNTNGAHGDTPVMFLTSRDSRADLDAARRAGVDAYVVNPVSPALLKHRLARLSMSAVGR